MRQLSDTELFKLAVGQSEQAAIAGAIRNKLNQNIGDIAPEQIEPELIQLETKSKNSFYPKAINYVMIKAEFLQTQRRTIV